MLRLIRGTGETSRGKTRNDPRVDAGFTKHTPIADRGLRGHVPARPGCTTPRIRFLFIAPRFCLGLPPDPTSRRCPCPSANLRLCVHLVSGLAPDPLRAMPGTHGGAKRCRFSGVRLSDLLAPLALRLALTLRALPAVQPLA